MKKSLSLLFVLMFSLNVFGQKNLFSGQPKNAFVKLNPKTQQFNYVPGKILVKFRDGISVSFKQKKEGLKSSLAEIDQLIGKYKIVAGRRLFPNEQRLKSQQLLTAFNGQKFIRPNLNNIYELNLASNDSLFQTIKALKSDSAQVEYAEPDYIYSIVSDIPESPVMNEKQAELWVKYHSIVPVDSDAVNSTNLSPNDPLYSQQWGIPAIQADKVWQTTTGDSTEIIAILDSGVDWKHPDLKDNIWTNQSPNSVPDANGVVNDVHGWDFINNDNDPSDDNSHGTHVAGIAAAEGNNGIGIAGVDWHAKIMPVKVFQSTGRGDAATIAKGIIYAANHGVNVINMSFGGYAESLVMDEALANAYANCFLVAAAGNDNKSIGPSPPPNAAPFYPAALPYVLGVQASQSSVNYEKGFKHGTFLTGFTNYDDDGPSYSRYPELLNYELSAPGDAIISTVPGGNYKVYSGTSMSTPMVAASVALYKQLNPHLTQEQIWGNLINTSKNNNIQLSDALNSKGKPMLWFVSNTIVDTLSSDNNNGLIDAGETIQLWFVIRNTWAHTDSVSVGLKFAPYEDTTVAKILKDTAFIGSISTYATRSNEEDPLLIHISPTVAHDRDIKFIAYLWCHNLPDTIKQQIIFTANHGIYLNGILDTTLVLTPDRLWLINNSFRIGNDGHLIIRPGVKIIISQGYDINVRGEISAIGKPDSLIEITGPGGGFYNDGSIKKQEFKYCLFNQIHNPFNYNVGTESSKEKFADIYYCIFNDCGASFGINNFQNNIYNYVVEDSINFQNFIGNVKGSVKFNDFIGPTRTSYQKAEGPIWPFGTEIKYNIFYNKNSGMLDMDIPDIPSSYQYNTFINPNGTTIAAAINYTGGARQYFPNEYWGTSDSAKISHMILDFWSDPSLPILNYEPILNSPPDSAHAIVWKVLVDGIDPQDQSKQMNPLGVGVHRFDVYFNRPMDTAYTPQLTFGVREPFTQQEVVDSAKWSDDNRVWTAFKTIQLYTGDGINFIRVSGARDLDNFENPIEDVRFHFTISAAESSSVDFMATPSIGKVNLEWNNSKISDLLGYNMYRMYQINDSTVSSPIIINDALITDTLYTDSHVVPKTKYYYYYKVVRTDFSESDSSKIITATPMTSSLGDANGDLVVNNLDVTSIVSYILGENPQPFITAAADINSDGMINIIDIVGDVKLVMESTKESNNTWTEYPTISLNDSIVQINSDNQLAGLQFELEGENLNTIQLTSLLKGYELSYKVVNGKILGLIYSFNDSLIPGGVQKIIKVENNSGQLKLRTVFGSDISEDSIPVTIETATGVSDQKSTIDDVQVSPNPFEKSISVSYLLNKVSRVQIFIYDINGKKANTLHNGIQSAGKYNIEWDGKDNSDGILPSGFYICKIKFTPLDHGKVHSKTIKILKLK